MLLFDQNYTQHICNRIASAVRKIDICMYAWRAYPTEPSCPVQNILAALIAAQRRGCTVRIITNFESQSAELAQYGFKVACTNNRPIMHAKTVAIDDKILFAGSHNFTKTSLQYNHEMSLVTEDTEACLQHLAYFQRIFDHYAAKYY